MSTLPESEQTEWQEGPPCQEGRQADFISDLVLTTQDVWLACTAARLAPALQLAPSVPGPAGRPDGGVNKWQEPGEVLIKSLLPSRAGCMQTDHDRAADALAPLEQGRGVQSPLLNLFPAQGLPPSTALFGGSSLGHLPSENRDL